MIADRSWTRRTTRRRRRGEEEQATDINLTTLTWQVGKKFSLPNGCVVAGPQPLCSEAFPDGLSSMSYVKRCKVKSANVLCKFITAVAQHCLDHNMVVVIENPRSSLYWRTSFCAPIRKFLKFTAHQACAYGSERPKWTVLAHNTNTLTDVCKVCPGISKCLRRPKCIS